jgi:hypothetical protein
MLKRGEVLINTGDRWKARKRKRFMNRGERGYILMENRNVTNLPCSQSIKMQRETSSNNIYKALYLSDEQPMNPKGGEWRTHHAFMKARG